MIPVSVSYVDSEGLVDEKLRHNRRPAGRTLDEVFDNTLKCVQSFGRLAIVVKLL